MSAMADINEDTPLLRRFSIPTVFTQPGCFEQMSDKTNFEEEYDTPACTYDLSLFSAPTSPHVIGSIQTIT